MANVDLQEKLKALEAKDKDSEYTINNLQNLIAKKASQNTPSAQQQQELT